MLKLQNTVSSFNLSNFTGQKKEEEEICSYRVKQTKNRKTIVINCKDCNSGSSLNDTHCRKNIFSILQKEIHADCLVLSRLYERDYEGETLTLLYAIAGFSEIITSYRTIERVPKDCTLPEKKRCDLERKEIIDIFSETVEADPLKARLEIKRFIQGKMLNKLPEIHPACTVCFKYFYHILHEIEEKLSCFPEIPTFKNADIPCPSLKMIENSKRGTQRTPVKRTKLESLIENVSGETLLTQICKWIQPRERQPEHIKPENNLPENNRPDNFPHENSPYKNDPSKNNPSKNNFSENSPSENNPFSKYRDGLKERVESKDNTDEFFDYESVIKPHVRPPFSSSRVYTEAPENTEFLECYDINGREGRKLEITIYSYTDRPEKLYMIRPPEYNLREEELRLLEKVRKRMIRNRPKDLAFTDPVGAREYFMRMAKEFLEEELLVDGGTCSPEELESYADLLARYTNGLGIVEDLLSDTRITDVYINAPADTNPVHVVMDGEECVSNVFLSQDDLDALVSRFRTISGRPFGEAVPVLELNLETFGVRVSVIGDPLSASGLAYAFRKHSIEPWTLPKLINTGSISPLAAGLLSFFMDGQASVLVAGEVGAGKTSLLSAMLLEIPQKYRILTIEDTHELPIEKLQNLGWKVQAMSSYSSVLKSGAEMSPETALRAGLRLGSSSLVLGEVRGEEVKVLYEAMQVGKTGNSVIGTIHGSSVENVYERIVHTLGVPPASFKATDAVIICSGIRLEGSMKKIKRVSRMVEVSSIQAENLDYSEIFTDVMNYDASQDCLLAGKALEQGQSELIEKIAKKWGISMDRALKSIELRTRIKEKIAIEGLHRPFLLEAEAVSQANNMFWLLTDSMGKSEDFRRGYESDSELSSTDDLENIYSQWEAWFMSFASRRSNIRDEQASHMREPEIYKQEKYGAKKIVIRTGT